MSGTVIKYYPHALAEASMSFFRATGMDVAKRSSSIPDRFTMYFTHPTMTLAEIELAITCFEAGWVARSRDVEAVIHRWANDFHTPAAIVPDEERDSNEP